jgi:hypothetical protein
MVSLQYVLGPAAIAALLVPAALVIGAAHAADDFPFGTEMTMEALPQPGSKRIPNLEIGDSGEVVIELWCKGGRGQFSVAGSSLIFVPGEMENRACPPARAQADDELLAALAETTSWKRQGEMIYFIGPKTLRFRINGN